MNHTNSKRHRDNAKLYEEAGVIVTEVQLRKDFDDDDFSFEEEEDEQEYEFDQESKEYGEDCFDSGSGSGNEEVSDNEEEDYEEPKKVGSLFGALAAFSDSSSSSSSDSSDEEDEEEGTRIEIETESKSVASSENLVEDDVASDFDDDLDLLEEIIYQNRLQERLYPEDDIHEEDKATEIVPVAFDDEQYNPDNFNADENRLVAVQHRLQKRCGLARLWMKYVPFGYSLTLLLHLSNSIPLSLILVDWPPRASNQMK